MIVAAAALLGAIVGSFLNALSFRVGTGRSVVALSGAASRSRCMRCGHELAARDLVPVLSYLFLRGRCRYCHTAISPQYPLVECAAAGLAAGVALVSVDLVTFALWFVVWMVLLFTFVYDLRHHVIPWSCSGLLAGLGLLWGVLSGPGWSLIAGPVVAAPLLLLSLVSRGRWMGWGDGAMMLGVGWLLGLAGGYTALMVGFWSGAAVGIAILALRRGYTMKSELPFAPFLIVGAGVAYFFHADIFATLPALLP